MKTCTQCGVTKPRERFERYTKVCRLCKLGIKPRNPWELLIYPSEVTK